MKIEEWKDIPDYEGHFQVSTFGNVRSLDRVTSKGRRLKGKTVKLYYEKNRYVKCALFMGVDKSHLVHRLVASAFIENPLLKKTVNHIDGDKHNNNLNNLEWATFNENMQHAFDTGLLENCTPLKGRKGEVHLNAKLKPLDIEMIKCLSKGGFNNVQISKRFNVTGEHIGLIVNNKTWVHLTGQELNIEL